MGEQRPSVGRIVHFVQGGVHYAAVVVYVYSETCVNLLVLPNGHTPFTQNPVVISSVSKGDANGNYTWHWPEYVA